MRSENDPRCDAATLAPERDAKSAPGDQGGGYGYLSVRALNREWSRIRMDALAMIAPVRAGQEI